MLFKCICSLLLIAVLSSAQPRSKECGPELTGLEGNITFPESRYRGYLSCLWNVVVPNGYRIDLQIKGFDFPGNCEYFWLSIDGILSENNTKYHEKLCQSNLIPDVFSFENHASVEYFRSERYYNYFSNTPRFALKYHAVPLDVTKNTAKWISKNTKTLLSQKESLPRALPALRLFNETYFNEYNVDGYKFKTQYLLTLSADLLRNSSQPLSAADWSHHVFALLAICTNPRSFHGFDLVGDLRHVVDKHPSLAKPFDFLALCNAGESLTSNDITNLKAVLGTEKPHIYMLDFQAIAIMTLICAKEQNKSLSVDVNLQTAAYDLTGYQKKDGSFGSLLSTVWIVQALSAARALESSWNKTSALEFIRSRNHTDGSFGSTYDMYAALSVLSGKTLLDINAPNCDFAPEGLIPLKEVMDKMTKFISLTYQLWIGDEAEVKHTIDLKFPNSTKFFDAMRLAAEQDQKFYLNWTFTKHHLYVYEIAGHVNDPTGGKYWNLYIYNDNDQLVLHEDRLENFIPNDGDIAVMWYRTVQLQE